MSTWAFAGKGTVGKSTIAAVVIDEVQRARDCRILVVDADPHMTLSDMLGAAPTMPTIGTLRVAYENDLAGRGPQNETRVAIAERLMAEHAITKMRGYDLLAMGTWTLQGSQCTVNRTLERGLLAVAAHYDLVIIDNEAGIEHVGRYSQFPIDHLLIVTQPAPLYTQIVKKIIEQCHTLSRPVGQMHVIMNNATAIPEKTLMLLADIHQYAPLLACLPPSAQLTQIAEVGASPLTANDDDPWRLAVRSMTTTLLSNTDRR